MSAWDPEGRRFTVSRDGQALAAEALGEGPAVVLLHGITASRRYVVHGSKILPRRGLRAIAFDARGHGESSPAPSGSGYSYGEMVDDLGAVLAQGRDRRHDVELGHPPREALDLLLDHRLGLRPLGLAHAQVARHDGLQVVHVVDADALDLAAGVLDVARHRDVDEHERPPTTRAHDDLEPFRLDDRVRRGGRGDDDVGVLQPRGQRVQRADLATEALGQRSRAVGVAVGDEDRAHALVGQRPGGQLGSLAGADDDHRPRRSTRSRARGRCRSPSARACRPAGQPRTAGWSAGRWSRPAARPRRRA